MKILYLSISFNWKKKDLYRDLVEELTNRGHELTIVTSVINDVTNESKLNYKIIDFNAETRGTGSLIKKGIRTIFIGQKFKKVILDKLKNEEFDLIMYATPPITLNNTIKFCKKKYNIRGFLMLKDIFPQNAVDLQMFSKKSLIYKFFRYQEKQLYKISDLIGCMSEGNLKYLLRNNDIDKSKIFIFPNSIQINKDNLKKKKESNITEFIFGGNLGKPQNIDGLLQLIKSLEDYELAKFTIIGNGSEKEKAKLFSSRNYEFHEFLPKSKYDEILLNADIGIISLDPRFTIPNIPSKLQSYMNLNKAIFAITDKNTDLKEIIYSSNCGWWVNASDIKSARETIIYICEHKQEQIIKGRNGYNYLLENYDVNKNIDVLEKYVEELNEQI